MSLGCTVKATLELKDGVSTSAPLSKSVSPTSLSSSTWATDLLWVQTPASHPNKFFPFDNFNTLNAELIPICYLLALLAHHFLHVSRIRVESLPLRLLMSYIYIYI
jgi:hypothetical protein